jgi:putative membrane protein
LLAAAVAVIQFVSDPAVPGGRYTLGALLAVLAVLTAVSGLLRWRQVDRAMRRGTALPRHAVPVYLAVGLGVIGLSILVVALVKVVTG